MAQSLPELPIRKTELSDYLQLDLRTQLTLDFYQAFRLRRSPAIRQFLITELSLLAVSLIFLWPLSLLVLRSLDYRPEEPLAIWGFLAFNLLTALLLVVGLNVYLSWRSRQVKTLARLLAEIEQFNAAVSSFELAVRLAELGTAPGLAEPEVRETLAVLQAIRGSLLRALEIEALIRQRQAPAQQVALLAQVEQDLAAIATLEASQSTHDYSSLLAEALQVGWAVRREVRALRRVPATKPPH